MSIYKPDLIFGSHIISVILKKTEVRFEVYYYLLRFTKIFFSNEKTIIHNLCIVHIYFL